MPGSGAADPSLTFEETKYLGGDLEHTHLVKGLDYALLQKVSIDDVCSLKLCFGRRAVNSHGHQGFLATPGG